MNLLDGINDTEDELYTFDSIIETKTISEGLEALEDIKGNCDLFDEGYQWDNEFSKQFDSDIDLIEKDLEYLKQSNEELQKLNTNHEKRIDKLEEILEILRRFIKSGESDLFDWCEQFDEVNNTNISRLIEEWLKK